MENCGNGNVILISNSISIETPRDSAGESETPAGPVLRGFTKASTFANSRLIVEHSDSINFWSNVEKVGLFPELIADIISEIRLVEITFVNHSQQQKSLGTKNGSSGFSLQ